MTAIDSTHIDLQGSTFAGSYTSGGSVATNALNYIKGYSGAISADADRSVRLTKTANFTIPRGLSGYQFDNLGAGGEVDFTLPTLADTDAFVLGTKFGFYVGAAQTLKVIATNSMTIRNVGMVSGSNGNIASSTIGCYVEIEAVSTSQWVVKSINGTWTVT
jgi:hypothetical protein